MFEKGMYLLYQVITHQGFRKNLPIIEKRI